MSNQEKENYEESIKYFEKGNLLHKENPEVGDFEWISFPDGRIKQELLEMFSEGVKRTCRITDIHVQENEDKEIEFLLRIEKKYNGERTE